MKASAGVLAAITRQAAIKDHAGIASQANDFGSEKRFGSLQDPESHPGLMNASSEFRRMAAEGRSPVPFHPPRLFFHPQHVCGHAVCAACCRDTRELLAAPSETNQQTLPSYLIRAKDCGVLPRGASTAQHRQRCAPRGVLRIFGAMGG